MQQLFQKKTSQVWSQVNLNEREAVADGPRRYGPKLQGSAFQKHWLKAPCVPVTGKVSGLFPLNLRGNGLCKQRQLGSRFLCPQQSLDPPLRA